MKQHIIEILMRIEPDQKEYYEMVWEQITLDAFVEYKINDVYENVPDRGFEDEYEKPAEITVEEYFSIIFDQIENKLNNSI